MSNSRNTSFIVSIVKWKITDDLIPSIGVCKSRSFRSETHAYKHFNSVIQALKDDGYTVVDFDKINEEIIEGVRAFSEHDLKGQKYVQNAVVFMNRNPVWTAF